MRWWRSASPDRGDVDGEVAYDVGRGLVAHLDLDQRAAGRAGGEPGVDQRLAEQAVGVGSTLHLHEEAAGRVQEVGGRRERSSRPVSGMTTCR